MEVGYFFAICAAIIWGIVYTIDQKILLSTSPFILLFFYSLVTTLVMLPFAILDKEAFKSIFFGNKKNLWLILACVLLSAVANFLILTGIKKLDAATASIIEIAYPFFVVLFSYVFFRSTPNVYFFIGGALILVGVVVVVKLA